MLFAQVIHYCGDVLIFCSVKKVYNTKTIKLCAVHAQLWCSWKPCRFGSSTRSPTISCHSTVILLSKKIIKWIINEMAGYYHQQAKNTQSLIKTPFSSCARSLGVCLPPSLIKWISTAFWTQWYSAAVHNSTVISSELEPFHFCVGIE